MFSLNFYSKSTSFIALCCECSVPQFSTGDNDAIAALANRRLGEDAQASTLLAFCCLSSLIYSGSCQASHYSMPLKSFQRRREIHSIHVTCAALEQLSSQASLHLPACHLPGQSGIILANTIVNFHRDLNTVTCMLILLLLLSLRLNNIKFPCIVSEEHSVQGRKLDLVTQG